MIGAETTVMTVAGIVCAVIAIASGVWIIRSLRRAKLTFAFGVAWLVIAVAVVVLGLGGGYIVDPIGHALGVSYPPALFFLLAILVLLGVCAHLSAQLAKLEQDVRAISQRYALDHSERHRPLDPARAPNATDAEGPGPDEAD